jgi:inosine-uridine nucleoside N-ribohydrolase
MKHAISFVAAALLVLSGCGEKSTKDGGANNTPPRQQQNVIFDTDANNELDDQHALAYLLFNSQYFNLHAVTVNATYNGGPIQGHYDEAVRILTLGRAADMIPVLKGANDNFLDITTAWDPGQFDGKKAVDYLLEQTKKDSSTIIAVGKLTNIALALKTDPTFAGRTRIVWLGSNYPEPGEYNQDNDTIAMNYVLNSPIPFEMVTVRYGKPSGTDAVKVTQAEVNAKMPGLGPHIEEAIPGRHGGLFSNFGDYSVSLFEHIDYHSDPPSRPLFDMVAVAIMKQPEWGTNREIPAPVLIDNHWVERPSNPRVIKVWENFNKEAILSDFYKVMRNPSLPVKPH